MQHTYYPVVCNGNSMKTIILIISLLLPLLANADSKWCDEVKSKGEGYWPIPEEAFTKERFEKSINTLIKTSNVNAEGHDYINVENELIYIEGYMLKLHKERNEFCKFIKTKAYVHH